MTCIRCNNRDKFTEKLGRCQRCMNQLMVLSVVSWVIWFGFFQSEPKSINAIALFMAASAFSGLLTLHWLMKFILIPLQKKTHPKKPSSRRKKRCQK